MKLRNTTDKRIFIATELAGFYNDEMLLQPGDEFHFSEIGLDVVLEKGEYLEMLDKRSCSKCRWPFTSGDACPEGWGCPKCGAVMAPVQVVCVNCTGLTTVNGTSVAITRCLKCGHHHTYGSACS